MSLKIRIISNEIISEIPAFDYLSDFSVSESLVYQTLRSVLLNLRSGNAHTKTRGEVRGGGKKPWKQKGTGRARHGSTRSPLWVGGGVVFGPRNTRNWHSKINKSARISTLKMLVKDRLISNAVFQLESGFNFAKTKSTIPTIEFLKKELNLKKPNLIITYSQEDKGKLDGFRNIQGVKLMNVKNLKLNWIAQTPNLIFTEDAKNFLEERLKNN